MEHLRLSKDHCERWLRIVSESWSCPKFAIQDKQEGERKAKKKEGITKETRKERGEPVDEFDQARRASIQHCFEKVSPDVSKNIMTSLVIILIGLGLSMLGDVTAANLNTRDVKCGADLYCSSSEYCSSYDDHCRSCVTACDINSHNYEPEVCEQKCQGKRSIYFTQDISAVRTLRTIASTQIARNGASTPRVASHKSRKVNIQVRCNILFFSFFLFNSRRGVRVLCAFCMYRLIEKRHDRNCFVITLC